MVGQLKERDRENSGSKKYIRSMQQRQYICPYAL